MAKKQKVKHRKGEGTVPNRPNVEFEDPAAKPSTEELASGPVERAVLGRQGMAGFSILLIALALFILIFGTIFYFLRR